MFLDIVQYLIAFIIDLGVIIGLFALKKHIGRKVTETKSKNENDKNSVTIDSNSDSLLKMFYILISILSWFLLIVFIIWLVFLVINLFL